MQVLTTPAIAVGAGAVYPYSEALLKACYRESVFDEEPYNMARVFGPANNRRIMVPRNMAPSITVDLRSKGVPAKFKSTFKPRNTEQSRVVEESVTLLKKGKSFMLKAPTGFGKTICAVDIIAQVGLKTLVSVNKEDIYDQWVVALKNILGLKDSEIGLIKGDICRTVGCKVVIGFIQSLCKMDRYPISSLRDFGLFITDECHRIGADVFSQSAYAVPAMLRLGISATTKRKDGKTEVMEAHIGPVMVSTELAPMTPKIIARISPWRCPQTVIKNKKTGKTHIGPIPHTAGKCMHIIKLLANDHARNVMLVNFTMTCYHKGRKVMIQSDLIEHIELLRNMCLAEGARTPDTAFYVGGMSREERAYAKTRQLIFCTYKMTSEATDIPDADTLVMGTPKSDVEQIVGRVIRYLEGKREPIAFDLKDMTSPVFAGYWNKRKDFYASIGAEVNTGT